eukprot:764850-Hanusia_phi.AAC.12
MGPRPRPRPPCPPMHITIPPPSSLCIILPHLFLALLPFFVLALRILFIHPIEPLEHSYRSPPRRSEIKETIRTRRPRAQEDTCEACGISPRSS